jgi:EmrB/QacA subfamily drug resistance transporter
MPSTELEVKQRSAVHPDLILGICCMSVLLVSMDVTIVNVALPAIQHDLHASVAQLQWIVDAYTLVVASLLMLSGSLSDRYGRRRVFQLGLTLFTSGSLLCSFAHTAGQLVTFRAMQGLGASMLNPVALSIIANIFPDTRGRGRAVGIWGAVAGVSLAIGPLLGGALTQKIGWRSIFWINVPIGILAVALAALFIPESKSKRARRFDPVGQLLVLAGLVTLIYAVIDGPRAGWGSPLIIGLFAAVAAIVVLFVTCELRLKEPLLNLRFFRSVPFGSAALLGFSVFACFAVFLFLNALYLQQARGLSAFNTGLCTLPLALAMIVSSPLSGRLVGTRGTRPALLISGSALMLSTLILANLTLTTPLPLLLLAYTLFGIGLGMVNPAIANNAVSGMPLSQAGVAAAVASTSRQVGAAIGVAVAGTVLHASHGRAQDIARATHPMWGVMTMGGAFVVLLGWASNTAWSRASVNRAASLLDG